MPVHARSAPASPRSYLFVPADRPDRFAKALACGADAVILDLEDAVATPAKTAARDTAANWLDRAPPDAVLVRLNATDTPWFADDLRLLGAHPAVQGLVVPKAAHTDELAQVAARAPGRAVAHAPGVTRLLFGSIDFQADLGIEGDDDALLFFRSQLVLASRLAGLDRPVDGVTTAVDDEQSVARDTARARRLGFGAKLCIHPRQVAVVRQGFAPSPAELAWARRVLAAAEAAAGAVVALDGRMVDAPVILQAQRTLDAAGP